VGRESLQEIRNRKINFKLDITKTNNVARNGRLKQQKP
jgi:hypothetical protein